MIFLPTSIPDVILIKPKVFSDERGFFLETYVKNKFSISGIDQDFVQDNHSGSRRNVLRGLHYQIQHAQGKLIRVVSGEIFDVAVDLRRNSPSFGKWVGVSLSAINNQLLWIPAGFAHGFYTLSDWAEVLYKATDYYSPEHERTLFWNDPEIAVSWPIPSGISPDLSAKDLNGRMFHELDLFE